MAKVISEEGSRFEDPNSVEAQVREYVKVKATLTLMEARQKELREKLFAVIDAEGFEDDKGNIQFELDDTVENVARIEKQRRVTRKIDEFKAEEILDRLGIKDEIYIPVPTLQEDLLMAAHYEGKISEEELDEMFPISVTWALMTKKS
jgi:hypothetical protein